MDPAVTVGGYVGVGLALTSILHTWYAGHVYDGLHFGVLFSERLRITRPLTDGYWGSLALGVVGFAITAAYVQVGVSVDSLTLGALLRSKLPEIIFGAAVLVGCSQVLGGASWSKFVLDGALLFMAFNVLVSVVQPPSFWNLFTVYAALIPTLGATWSVWRDAFVEQQVVGSNPDGPSDSYPHWDSPTHDRDHDDQQALLYPHFPSFSYFAVSAAYTLVVSLFLVVQNVR